MGTLHFEYEFPLSKSWTIHISVDKAFIYTYNNPLEGRLDTGNLPWSATFIIHTSFDSTKAILGWNL